MVLLRRLPLSYHSSSLRIVGFGPIALAVFVVVAVVTVTMLGIVRLHCQTRENDRLKSRLTRLLWIVVRTLFAVLLSSAKSRRREDMDFYGETLNGELSKCMERVTTRPTVVFVFVVSHLFHFREMVLCVVSLSLRSFCVR